MTASSLRCRVGVHSWDHRRSDEGEAYIVCRRCGKESDQIHLADYGDTGGGSMG
jgi:hypothetical protein